MNTNSLSNKIKTSTAILYWEEDVYIAECPEVGTTSQGESVEEAVANLKEATELYLAEFTLLDTSRRLITTEDFILYLNFKTYCHSSSLQERVQKNPS